MAAQPATNISIDEATLGHLAMKFRGTRDHVERRAIANQYAETVGRLVQSGHWDQCPSPEDQLPEDWMPEAFSKYWLS